MNIGLIGAAGSGKTQLAEALAGLQTDVEIVDDYIPEIEKETNLAIDEVTNYLGNLYVALGRYARERHARERNEHVITCGTLIDTAVYAALDIAAQARIVRLEENPEEGVRAQALMMMLSCLFVDIFHYDHIFYLPSVSEAISIHFFDQNVQAAIAGFKLIETAHVLIPESRLETAKQILGW